MSRRRHSHGDVADRVIYKADNGEEFFVFANPFMVEKWRKDRTVPLTDVVQTFDVFTVDSGGNQGIATRPSAQRIANAMNVETVDDAVRFIVENGTVRHLEKVTNPEERVGKLFGYLFPSIY
jgi:ribosome maturation protein Sdo1